MATIERSKRNVLFVLKGKELSQRAIVAESGLARSTVRRILAVLMEEKAIHISAWGEPGNSVNILPIYAIGNAQNAPKPVLSEEYVRRRQRLWKRQDRMKKRIEANKGNPFGPIMAQVVKKGSGGRTVA